MPSGPDGGRSGASWRARSLAAMGRRPCRRRSRGNRADTLATRPPREMRTTPVAPRPSTPSSHRRSRETGTASTGWERGGAAWGSTTRRGPVWSGDEEHAGTGASGIPPALARPFPAGGSAPSTTPKSARCRDSDEESNRWVEAEESCVCADRFDCRLVDRFMSPPSGTEAPCMGEAGGASPPSAPFRSGNPANSPPR